MSFDSDGKGFKEEIFTKNRRETGKLRPSNIIKLPLTKHMLWSSVSAGPTVVVNLTYSQKPAVTVDLSAINTGFKSILKRSKRVLVCYLHGNISSCSDGEKLTISLGKLEIIPESPTQFHEPISDNKYSSLCNMRFGEINSKSYQDVSDGSVQNMKRLLRSSKLDLGSILPSRVECVFDEKSDGRVGCNVTFNCVIAATTFQAAPVRSLPVLCTALSKSLADPFSQSSIHKEPKSGFITMNEKRQLLLLLENDPKVHSLPLVGIWVNGVNSVRDIYTWRAALRYLRCDVPNEKIYNEAGCFLVLLYRKVDPTPAVYEFSIIEDLSVPDTRRLTAQQYFTFSFGNTTGKITLELREADATTEIDASVENRKEMIKDGSVKGKLQFTPGDEGDIAPNKRDKEIYSERMPPRVFHEMRRSPAAASEPRTTRDLYEALAAQERELRLLRSQLDKLLKQQEGPGRVSACTMTSNVWSPAPCKCSCGAKRATDENPSCADSNLESIHLGDVKMATATNYASPDASVRIDLPDFSQSSLGLTLPSEYPNSQTSHMGSDSNSANDVEDEALYGNLLERINAMLGQQPYLDSDRETTNHPDEEDTASSRLPCESMLLPKLQHVSLWDAGKTFIDESALFDSLAVKYLRRKQGVFGPTASTSREHDPSSSSVTVYGLGANNVSLATKDYLKKYRLL